MEHTKASWCIWWFFSSAYYSPSITQDSVPDQLRWQGKSVTDISVKRAYVSLSSSTAANPPWIEGSWSWIWRLKVSPKVQAWVWNIALTSACPRCNADTEDIAYSLLWCPKSAALWSLIWAKLRLLFIPTTLEEWWKCLHGQNLGTNLVKDVRQSWIAYGSWLPWKDRNDGVFNNRSKPVHDIFVSTKAPVLV